MKRLPRTEVLMTDNLVPSIQMLWPGCSWLKTLYRTLFCSNLADQHEAVPKVLQFLFRRDGIKSQYRAAKNGKRCHLLSLLQQQSHFC